MERKYLYALAAVVAMAVFLLFFGKFIASNALKSYIISEQNSASYCETQADCEYVGYVCGVINAGVFVNKQEAGRMRQLIEMQHGLSDVGSCDISRYPTLDNEDIQCMSEKYGMKLPQKRCMDKHLYI